MSEISSPCVNVCQLDPEGEACIGCGRTRAEIGGWMGMSEAERAAIMERLARARRDAAQEPSSRAC